MEESRYNILDRDIRHFIYKTFAATAHPPTTFETAQRFKISVAEVEEAYERLERTHHIALTPGFHQIRMAHPFSSLATNFVTVVGQKKYWGN